MYPALRPAAGGDLTAGLPAGLVQLLSRFDGALESRGLSEADRNELFRDVIRGLPALADPAELELEPPGMRPEPGVLRALRAAVARARDDGTVTCLTIGGEPAAELGPPRITGTAAAAG
jgi:hypothetical protein